MEIDACSLSASADDHLHSTPPTENSLVVQSDGEIETELTEVDYPQQLTEKSLAEQNDCCTFNPSSTRIQAWAAVLPSDPLDSFNFARKTTRIFEIGDSNPFDTCVRGTKDVFTDAQKVAYVGLCAVTSAEVVHEFQGAESTNARMSAGNWQRNLMKLLYLHMEISSEEIQMIESLTKHNIQPSNLVHQFTAQGDTNTLAIDANTKHSIEPTMADSTAKLEDQITDPEKIIIDLRWTVMCDLIFMCLDSESYDARSRVFIFRVASHLSLEKIQVMEFEKRITKHLLQDDTTWETETVTSTMTTQNKSSALELHNTFERQSHNKRRKKKRLVMIGLATIGGGLILGLSAGFMAPVIAGGLGAVLTTAGVTGASGFLTGTAGVGLITGAATMTGVRLGAKSMNRRMKSVNTFEFLPILVENRVNCFISVAGWLSKTKVKEEAALPFSSLDSIMGDHYALYWEPEMLEELGSAFKIFATEAVTFSIQQALAHTIMGALLAGLTFPLALTKLGYLVDNPWANALDRSRLAGLILADALMNRNLGSRPVTLVGYSLGARVIFYCLLELARVNAYGLVEDVALFGTPVSTSHAQWKECTTVVSGRFINGYATNDWLLGFLFRASIGGLRNVAGLRPLENAGSNYVENLDCTDLVNGHLMYRSAMPRLLKLAGFVVTSEEISEPSVEKIDVNSPIRESSQSERVHQADVSSLNSGTASIHVPLVDDQRLPSVSSSSSASSFSSYAYSFGKSPSIAQDTFLPSESNRTKRISDVDILSSIMADASIASTSKAGFYSSLSCGRASIASSQATVTTGRQYDTSVIPNAAKRSNTIPDLKSSRFNIFRKKSRAKNKTQNDLEDAGVQVKEMKSTLGCMIVPDDIMNPLPKITLEMPKFAQINR